MILYDFVFGYRCNVGRLIILECVGWICKSICLFWVGMNWNKIEVLWIDARESGGRVVQTRCYTIGRWASPGLFLLPTPLPIHSVDSRAPFRQNAPHKRQALQPNSTTHVNQTTLHKKRHIKYQFCFLNKKWVRVFFLHELSYFKSFTKIRVLA